MLEGYKTFIGLAVTALGFVAQHYGYTITPELQTQVSQWLLDGLQLIGLVYAAYGRAIAVTPGPMAKLQGH